MYAFYSRTDYSTQVVVRFADCAGTASEPTTLMSLPAGPDCCHKGGRLVFGPDGKLFVTLGDEHATTASSVNSETSVPQDPSDVRGKILRYNADGSIPADNPFGADGRGVGNRPPQRVRARVRPFREPLRGAERAYR